MSDDADAAPTQMISDLDIYRAGNLVIKRYGSDAVIEAARMVDRMLELGDLPPRLVFVSYAMGIP